MMPDDIPAPTVRRLPGYLRTSMELASDGVGCVSSSQLASLMGCNAATVRRDLSALGVTGTRGVGYDVKHLVYEISIELGVNQQWPVVVVGAGNLGKALASYAGMAERGFPVQALVDVAPDLIGTQIAGVPVIGYDELPAMVSQRGVVVGVIATPAAEAQRAVDVLVAAGIASLLNFTGQSVTVPDSVVARRVDLATELQILSFYHQRSQGVATGSGVPLVAPGSDALPDGNRDSPPGNVSPDGNVSPAGIGDNVESRE